jgi:hypothetical protein
MRRCLCSPGRREAARWHWYHPLARRHSREIIEIVTPQSLTIKAGVFATD